MCILKRSSTRCRAPIEVGSDDRHPPTILCSLGNNFPRQSAVLAAMMAPVGRRWGFRMLVAASSGKDLVSEKSVLMQKLAKIPPIRSIQIIDDNRLDAEHVSAVLHLLLGRDVIITQHKSMAVALETLRRSPPDLIFLDDYLPPLDRAESSMKSLQRFGYTGPIVVMSGSFTRARKTEISAFKPLGLLPKDDINSFAMAEVLARLGSDRS